MDFFGSLNVILTVSPTICCSVCQRQNQTAGRSVSQAIIQFLFFGEPFTLLGFKNGDMVITVRAICQSFSPLFRSQSVSCKYIS